MQKQTNHFIRTTLHHLFALIILLSAASCIGAQGSSFQASSGIKVEPRVDFSYGLLSVSAENILLVDLIQRIGKQAGFNVITLGNLGTKPVSFSFSQLNLKVALEKILKGISAIISYRHINDSNSEPLVSKVFLLGTWSGSENRVHINTVEVKPANQGPVDRVQSGSLQTRLDAIDRLEGLSDDLTVSNLIFSLQHDPDPALRIRAVSALQKIGGSRAVSALENGLGDDNSSVRMKVVQALGSIQDERTPLWLGQVIIGDPSADVRHQAVIAISPKDSDTTQIFLRAAINDKSLQVREAAINFLK